jgi:hypothetical protein
MLVACVEGKDPEANYLAAVAYCGQTDPALDMLKRAIKGNYCSTAAA